MARKKTRKPQVWQEYLSLGAGLIFLSILAFIAAGSFEAGSLIFLMGLFLIMHGEQLKGKRSQFSEWVSLKVFQSFILIVVGIVLMSVLPSYWFGGSLIVTLIGFSQFTNLKLRYFGRLPAPKKMATSRKISPGMIQLTRK